MGITKLVVAMSRILHGTPPEVHLYRETFLSAHAKIIICGI
ncbi:hypothetical protein [Sulfuracidifex tepidarius]|nr:hypothetical protein [Sulfuracidifex tepidarius]